mmetsp:Transcript_41165/g.120326  ORF Transcript_41165/g.120326 Transcript_41165/m.120326 type:complete len:273 (-) Transcript_41165:510-1328(-)
MVVLLQLVVGDLEAVGAVRVRRLLRGPPLGVGPVAAVADRIRQRADEQRRERADRERLEQLGAAGGAVLVAQEGEAAVEVVEQRAEQPAHEPDDDEHRELAQLVVVAVGAEEGAKRDEARVRELPEDAAGDDGRLEQVEREGGGERAAEGAPRQRLRPVRRRLLHRKQHASDRRAERGRDAGGGAGRDEIALVVVVAEALEEHGADGARLGRALRQPRRHDRSRVDHRPLLAHHEPAGDRERDADRLAHERRHAQHARHAHTLQVGLDLRDA